MTPVKRIPPWVPFNNIPKTANAGRKLLFSMVTRPFQYAKREMRPCFVRDCLDKFDAAVGSSTISKEEQDHLILWAAGSMYGAGGESTYASILSFIIAMARFPAVQKKIQDEIDAVVGRERLPTVSDQPSMPYVNAAVKEVLRWRPALPCGIARRTKRDEEYKGILVTPLDVSEHSSFLSKAFGYLKELSSYPTSGISVLPCLPSEILT
ncbi:hypothetical protein AAF712_008317 [Marasmius tenuissimus]|uniref:Cytochrome P450 n=1 Tax=Marasmius tenuissimus TaxID=585030 RepID=A0ABR2ZSY1_9AGAR